MRHIVSDPRELFDFTAPMETKRILKNVSTHSCLLESAQVNETWARYTFLGFDPTLERSCPEGGIVLRNSMGEM